MARTRLIKPSFFEDQKIAKLPIQARMMFIGIWTLLDKTGLGEFTPIQLRNFIFGYDDVTVKQTEKWLDALIENGFLTIVDYKGQSLYYCKNFKKWQSFTQREQAKYDENHILDAASRKYSTSTVQVQSQTCASTVPVSSYTVTNTNTDTNTVTDTAEHEPNSANADSFPEIYDSFFEDWFKTLKPEIVKGWGATYRDFAWIKQEILKAKTWCIANPSKAPKSNYARFITNWLARSFENHRKGIPSQSTNKAVQRNNDNIAAANDALKILENIRARRNSN